MNEVIAHLADAEVAFAFRLRKMAAERRPTLATWDQEAWAKGLRYRTADSSAGLAAFGALRGANLNVLARLSRARRKRAGRHPEYGKITVEELVRHYADHDLNHARQIRTTLRRLGER